MEVFEIIAGACSILSLLVSLFVANKVVQIKNSIKILKKNHVSVSGDDNITSGRDTKIKA
ncbi:hypothetical protein PY092_18880 [Muricauda sp. 334s03]|uniref:Uncharacterized protein n=1 Tax=Flagellimonas yonaguniensis TaxID=3031325 RepID=A0ABT5Y462_9FLAO|nr:hypothetical protein [[Muricauda] yonaguniensis]MDF0718234.1 hypothetical protein [[Muricauda] yonaguniensis]